MGYSLPWLAPLRLNADAQATRVTARRLGRLRCRSRRRPRHLGATPGYLWLAVQLLDDGFLLAREGEAPDFSAIPCKPDVMMVRLADADIREPADVGRKAEVDDRRLEIQRHAAVSLQRLSFQLELEGINRQVCVCAKIRLKRLDFERTRVLGLERLREFELKISLNVVEADYVNGVFDFNTGISHGIL